MIFEQRKHVGADVGVRQDIEAARQLGPHDPARARHQKIVEGFRRDMRLRDLGARIVGEIGVVE